MKNLLYTIDSKIQGQENLSEQKVLKRKSPVIIINQLDENYHKRILNESDPQEIIKKLRGYRNNESNVTQLELKLYQTKMKK